MIYNQEFFYYFLTIVFAFIICYRLNTYLKYYFPTNFSVVIALTMLLHPLSIDMFLAPNLIIGAIAFYMFIEAMIFHQKKSAKGTVLFSFLAMIFNLSYCLLPLYFFWRYRKELSKFYIPVIVYPVLLSVYLWKHALLATHNPLTLFSYFTLNVFLPLNLSVIDYSTFNFDLMTLVLAVICLLILFWREQTDKRSREFWPFIFLPLIGCFFHQWVEGYKFWNEIILTPSNYLCITFAIILMIAIHLPQKFFSLYAVCMIVFSFFWATSWFPYSNVLRSSIVNVPGMYVNDVLAKRTLAWELLHEKRIKEGEEILMSLNRNNNDPDLKFDLEFLKSQTQKTFKK